MFLHTSSLSSLCAFITSCEETWPGAAELPKTAFGLYTLDWFPTDITWPKLWTALQGWVEMSWACEDRRAWEPAPSCINTALWTMSCSDYHFSRSLHIGLTPGNLYCALVMDMLQGRLRTCHMTGLSLRSPEVPITLIAHRIHGISFSSGFTTAVPTHCKQYSHSARNFIVESRAANWVRRGWDGAVLLNNLVNCIPLVMDSIDGHFEQTIAPQLRAQLLELSADPSLMVRRATSIDPYTLINRANKTQAAVLWRRLFAHQSEHPLSVRRRTPSGSDQSA